MVSEIERCEPGVAAGSEARRRAIAAYQRALLEACPEISGVVRTRRGGPGR